MQKVAKDKRDRGTNCSAAPERARTLHVDQTLPDSRIVVMSAQERRAAMDTGTALFTTEVLTFCISD
jgi:hypothetical protein